MNRFLHHAAFVLGLAAVGWVGFGYLGVNGLALAVTLAIGAFYLMGAVELLRFRRSVDDLSRSLAALPDRLDALGPWLAGLPSGLGNAVRLRIEGERVGLPGPALVPYLTGLLVLLGMLGTFLGMVVTLNGTGLALETAKDLQGIRASLSGPVRGLGLAFGTSIAGVAASAMLGLMSSLSRRDALLATQRLDTRIATTLRPFSPIHQREETFRLLQRQAEVMPALVDRLEAMIGAVERQGETLGQRLVDGQERFHGEAQAAFAGLASSVDRSLQASLVESARVAGATLAPIAEATMAAIAREAGALHERVAHDTAGLHRGVADDAAALHGRVAGDTAALHRALADDTAALHRKVGEDAAALHREVGEETAALQRQASFEITRLATDVAGNTVALVGDVARGAVALQEQAAGGLARHLDTLTERFESTTVRTAQLWEGALERHRQAGEAVTADLRLTVDRIAATFEQHSASLIGEVGRSAADTIGELRQRLADSLAADNAMLDERRHVMEALGSLMDSATRASVDQRSAIEAMVGSTTELMDRAGQHFAQQAERTGSQFSERTGAAGQQFAEHAERVAGQFTDRAESAGRQFTEQVDIVGRRFTEGADRVVGQLAEKAGDAGQALAAASADIVGSAAEVASLGEAFGRSVQLFGQASEKLVAQLHGIEQALAASTARSDDQLAYYVAQAREVIDLSLMSQKQIVDDLQQIAARQAAASTA